MKIEVISTSSMYGRFNNLLGIYVPIIRNLGIPTTEEIYKDDYKEEVTIKIDIDSISDVLKIQKELGIDLIITFDNDCRKPLIEIYDDYRE